MRHWPVLQVCAGFPGPVMSAFLLGEQDVLFLLGLDFVFIQGCLQLRCPCLDWQRNRLRRQLQLRCPCLDLQRLERLQTCFVGERKKD